MESIQTRFGIPKELAQKKIISLLMLTTLILFVTGCNLCHLSSQLFAYKTAFAVIDLYFTVLLESSLEQAIFSDPGYLTRGERDQYAQNKGNSVMCQKCYAEKSNYVHHCMKCGRCVELYDHHCNVFANCFGAHSVGHIFKFLLNGALYLGLSAAQLFPVNMQCFKVRATKAGWSWFLMFYFMLLNGYEAVGSVVLAVLAVALCRNQIFRGIGQLERRLGIASNGLSCATNFRRNFARNWLCALLIPFWPLGPRKAK